MGAGKRRPNAPRDTRGADDLALEELLGLEAIWRRKHLDFTWHLDQWGEGPSNVSFSDLGLDTRLRRVAILAVCPRHGEFAGEWAGRLGEDSPAHVRCTAGEGEQRCPLYCPVSFLGLDDDRAA